MKTNCLNLITVLFFVSIVNTYSFSQCIASAGKADIHRCSPDLSVQLGGHPTAFGGVPPYVYTWSIDPIFTLPGFKAIPFVYASRILDDTTSANPRLKLLDGASFIGDSLMFYLKVTDNNGCQSFDTVLLTTSRFMSFTLGDNIVTAQGDTIRINQTRRANFCPCTYSWSPGYGLSDSTVSNPLAFPDKTTDYTATVKDKFGCTATRSFRVHVRNKKSITELNAESNRVTIYPNPTKDLLNLEIKDNLTISAITLYDVLGKKVKTYIATERKLNIKGIANGQYILKINTAKGLITKKVMVK